MNSNSNRSIVRYGLAVTSLLAGLLLGAGAVLAQTADSGGSGAPVATPTSSTGPHMSDKMQARCQANPDKCEQMKQRMQEKRAACQQDPEACKQKREAHRAAMKEKCAQDPDACKQKRAEMHKKFEARCQADPEKCAEWKKNHPHHKQPEGTSGDNKPSNDKPMEPPPRAAN